MKKRLWIIPVLLLSIIMLACCYGQNGDGQEEGKGTESLSPSSGNPYISHLAKASQKLGKCVIDAYCKATGFKNRGMKTNDTMTGINWSEIPVTIIELGF